MAEPPAPAATPRETKVKPPEPPKPEGTARLVEALSRLFQPDLASR